METRPEFRKLVKLCGGNDDQARGMLIRFWRVAQERWGHHKLLSSKDMEDGEFDYLIDSRWAIERDGSFYAIGSEERFAWYRAKCDAAVAGGRARSAAARDENGRYVTQPGPAGHQPGTSRAPAGHQPGTSPLAPAPVLAPAKIQNTSLRVETANAAPPEEDLPGRRLVREYVESYRKRYGAQTRPEITGKTAGQVKQLLKTTPLPRAIQLVQVYLQMDDRWFETKCHDFSTFMENLTKVALALDTGQNPGGVRWDEIFATSGREVAP